jgi:hypothetical protein
LNNKTDSNEVFKKIKDEALFLNPINKVQEGTIDECAIKT